ncbi:immunoglobulin lambda-1 light chain-like isoform X2 [Brachyhypopomus gauderio]|uniref:immunoglobulin lambda-1 light chain-like isoform X2 n=1 Tax=Brachyhypopomus gauderio TaxID=698409 RepID=UPI004041DEDB
MLSSLCVLLPALRFFTRATIFRSGRVSAQSRVVHRIVYTGVSSQKVVTQTPSVLTDKGQTVTLNCNVAKDDNRYVSWYKQIPQAAPQFILRFYHSHSSPDLYGDFPAQRFTSKASSDINYQLIISDVEAGDSAMYYCGTWDSSVRQAVFGQGTTLKITDTALPPPVLTLFPPSSEELKSDRVTLVCGVSDMVTGFSDVRWLVDENPVTSGVLTGSAQQQPNNKFKLSSYLTIQSSEWKNDKTITCEISAGSQLASRKIQMSKCLV